MTDRGPPMSLIDIHLLQFKQPLYYTRTLVRLPAGFGPFGPPLHLRPCTWYIPNYPILPKSHFPKNPFSPIKPIQNTISSHFPKISFSQNHIFLKSFFPKSYPQKSPFPKITFSQSHFPKIKFSQKNIFPQSHFPAIPFLEIIFPQKVEGQIDS